MPEAWSREEVEATVTDYFDMLTRELRDEPYVKKDHNRRLQPLLNNRSAGAIEKKHQNISSILISEGQPYIRGYQPLGNYQSLLRDVVIERLPTETDLQLAAIESVSRNVTQLPMLADPLKILVPKPVVNQPPVKLYDRPAPRNAIRVRNYLEIEARNQSLGGAGEELILKFEHERLWKEGKRNLADKIEHVARTRGDGAGYDILSFETDGRERLIEVKTTRYGGFTPFFASRSEVSFSELRDDHYQLYRLYAFEKEPKLFILQGALRKTCTLDPVVYQAEIT